MCLIMNQFKMWLTECRDKWLQIRRTKCVIQEVIPNCHLEESMESSSKRVMSLKYGVNEVEQILKIQGMSWLCYCDTFKVQCSPPLCEMLVPVWTFWLKHSIDQCVLPGSQICIVQIDRSAPSVFIQLSGGNGSMTCLRILVL